MAGGTPYSEQETAKYDTSQPPAVGDKGLLLKLEDNTLYFFKKQPSMLRRGTSRAWLTYTGSPSTTGYNFWVERTTAGAWDAGGTIWKFDTPLRAPNALTINAALASAYNAAYPPIAHIYSTLTTGFSYTLQSGVSFYAITEDFDISTVDYTAFSALSKVDMWSTDVYCNVALPGGGIFSSTFRVANGPAMRYGLQTTDPTTFYGVAMIARDITSPPDDGTGPGYVYFGQSNGGAMYFWAE